MTVKDLLYKYLDYRSRWTVEHMAKSKPGMVRLKQINALLDAFGLSKKYANPEVETYYSSQEYGRLNRQDYLKRLTDMEYMAQGEFLRDNPIPSDGPLVERLLEELRKGGGYVPGKLNKHFPALNILWGEMLRLRYGIFDLTQHHVTIYEGYIIGLHYSGAMKRMISEKLEEPIARMDSVLCEIMDPKGRTFSEADLIADYGFPSEEELREAEVEWSQDDYF